MELRNWLGEQSVGPSRRPLSLGTMRHMPPLTPVPPAGQQIRYGLIILLMLFVYGRNARVQE